MGWYTALACAGALDAINGFRLVNTMGTLMHQSLIGGQLLYPFVDEDWREIPGRRQALLDLVNDIPNLYVSILLGGMLVFAGDKDALSTCEHRLEPVQGRFPLRLPNHSAFHSPLQSPVAAQGRLQLPESIFASPDIPLIDGRGTIWLPHATSIPSLYAYTLGYQVTEIYDFNAALSVTLKEFAPDALIVLGPGNTLGGAIGQQLVNNQWQGITCKPDFIHRQSTDPFVISMGLSEQRQLAVKGLTNNSNPQ